VLPWRIAIVGYGEYGGVKRTGARSKASTDANKLEERRMSRLGNRELLAAWCAVGLGLLTSGAHADEIIKYGFSSTLTGPGAPFGKGQEWLCNHAAQEIKDSGGIKVQGKTYNIQCIAYDNKYNAAEATKVAQTLLNLDGVKVVFAAGTAPVLATQSLTERQGVLLFSVAVGQGAQGPQFPLTFNTVQTAYQITPSIISYVKKTYPNAHTITMVDISDATGKQFDAAARKMWEDAGYAILTQDYYERGTTEFQPIAARLVSFNADIIDMPSVPPSEAGRIIKEIDTLGFKGIKIFDTGGSADQVMATGGASAEGTIMGNAVPWDGPSISAYDRKINDDAKAAVGISLGIPQICGYDPLFALKAAMEKAQSTDPKEIAKAMPTVQFRTLMGGMAHFGGKEIYGANSQEMTPIYITQIEGGKLVEKAKIEPK
jgi:branched-chain amino acid transport system substrate-binding protein